MSEETRKFQQQQKQEPTETRLTEQKTEQQTSAHEFSSVEEMLRFDAAQTEVPPRIESRLAESVQKELLPDQPRPWWKKLFDWLE